MDHHRICTLCEAMCGIVIETEADRVVGIRGDEDDAFSKGHICPKATALGDIHHDPDRLKQPQRRTSNGWATIGWNEALDEVGARLRAIRDAYGPKSVAVYLGNPSAHNYGTILNVPTFMAALGSHNRFSATSVDQLPKMLASLSMYGHQLMFSIPDVDRTQYFLCFGANPLVSNGSIMTAPGIKRRLEAIKARGGKLVVFDPRRSETARIANEHVFVKPGTDALVLAAMVHTLFEEKLVNVGRLASDVRGLETLRQAVVRFTPARVAQATSVPAETIRRIAREFATADSAVAYGRVGISNQSFGGVAHWLVEALNIITGNLDRAGGAMFTTPAADLVKLGALIGQQGHFDQYRSRVRGAPEFGGELPVSCLAEEIEEKGEGQIRALVTIAGNPVLSTPNGRRLDAALAKLDFYCAIDIYRNETTRHAHVILPPTFALEHDHYDLVFHSVAVRNTARFSLPVFDPSPDQRHDWQILGELAVRLTESGTPLDWLASPLKKAIAGQLEPKRIVDMLVRMGPHGMLSDRKLTLDAITKSVHGIDLGALEPTLPGRLFTGDKKIHLAPERYLADMPRLEASIETFTSTSRDTLSLISRRELRSNNSWCHNSERLVKGKDRCTLRMHPTDAETRGLRDGQRVRIRSRVGEIHVPLEISDEMMPGVVCMPHGWGHDREGTKMGVAAAHPGVSINDVTDESLLDGLAGTANLSGVLVSVESLQVVLSDRPPATVEA